MLKKIVSFGIKHGWPQATAGAIIVDVRHLFRNPYQSRKLRDKTGHDPEVEAEVLKTMDFKAKYDHIKEQVTSPGVEVAYIACHGGRHRSVFLASRLGQELGVAVEHRDVEKGLKTA